MNDLCVWCIQIREVYITNGRQASLCEDCCGELQRRLPYVNTRKELPHRYQGEERRMRPMPNPFEKPKMEEFKHGLPND